MRYRDYTQKVPLSRPLPPPGEAQGAECLPQLSQLWIQTMAFCKHLKPHITTKWVNDGDAGSQRDHGNSINLAGRRWQDSPRRHKLNFIPRTCQNRVFRPSRKSRSFIQLQRLAGSRPKPGRAEGRAVFAFCFGILSIPGTAVKCFALFFPFQLFR
jgi:hypothetical protein